jgi:hypothetical protein
MKKKKLHGLSLNKKSIANFATVVGGINQVPAPTNYKGCVDSFNICIESALCYISDQCVTIIQCPTLAECPFTACIPDVCC